MNRCTWVGTGKPHYEAYHDTEWGVPVHDDRKHFEMLILEGAQAGLSFETILKRRENYRVAFKQFAPFLVANMTDEELEMLLTTFIRTTPQPIILKNAVESTTSGYCTDFVRDFEDFLDHRMGDTPSAKNTQNLGSLWDPGSYATNR